MKLCLIDEPLGRKDLQDLFPTMPEITEIEAQGNMNAGITTRKGIRTVLSHGTLCMAVLIEALQRLGILYNIELYHFSVGYLVNSRAEHSLYDGLKFCADNNIDLISCSLGIHQHLWAAQIISRLQKKSPLVVAAAANNCHITYPAALPSVLGVRMSDTIQDLPAVMVDSPDGVDYLSQCTRSEVLLKMGYGFSNSILAPQVCAQVARLALDGVTLNKEDVLNALTGGNKIQIKRKPDLHGHANPDEDPPVILIPFYGDQYVESYRLAVQLQRHFEENGYGCSVLSDRLLVPDFEQSHYPINNEQDIVYYTRAVETSVFLLVTQHDYSYDLKVDPNLSVSKLFEKIICAFPENGQEESD